MKKVKWLKSEFKESLLSKHFPSLIWDYSLNGLSLSWDFTAHIWILWQCVSVCPLDVESKLQGHGVLNYTCAQGNAITTFGGGFPLHDAWGHQTNWHWTYFIECEMPPYE